MITEHMLVGRQAACCLLDRLEEEIFREDEETSLYGVASSMTVMLESGVRDTADLVLREQRMRLLHEALKVVKLPPKNCELRVLLGNTVELVELKLVRLLELFCSDIPDIKEISTGQYGDAVRNRALGVS